MRIVISFLILLCAPTLGLAQDSTADWVLLQRSVAQQVEAKKPIPARTWNPLKLTYRLGLGFYQNVISSQLATNCAFELTCSRYSGAMVKEFGLMKGYFLTFDRISRCTKISSMETYPVRLTALGKIRETPEDFHFHR